MRSTLMALFYCLCVLPLANAASLPTTQPSGPTTRHFSRASMPPVEVPFSLTDTNHLLVRLKINGKGPFNFIVDTGAPAMILRVPIGEKLGVKTNSRGIAYLDKLEIEGGAELKHVMCVVQTPYQIEGMNAVGASGVELDGLLGYSVLAKFRLQIDMTRDRMVWTPINFTPPPAVRTRRVGAFASTRPTTQPDTRDIRDDKEDDLEFTGGLLKLLGPMIKTTPLIPRVRGFLGIELAGDQHSVSVLKVFGGSAAAAAGVRAGDRVMAVNDQPENSIAEVQRATARTLSGGIVRLSLRRGSDLLNLTIIAGEGL